MKRGKRIAGRYLFLPTLFCLLTVFVSACGGGSGSGTGSKLPDDKQIYVVPISGSSDVQTLDPALSTDVDSITAIETMFVGLVQLNDKLEVYGELAQSWETSKDGLTWTFKLRPNLKFSDGNPITADDVIYSIDRALKPELKSTVAPSYLSLIKDSEARNSGKLKTLIGDSLLAPDASTVKIITKKRAQYFLDALTYSTSYVVEKSFVEKYGDTEFLKHLNEGGLSGPFKLAEHTPSQQIVLVPNSNYWGPKPQLKKLVYAFYKDPQTTYKAYQTNQVDNAAVPTENLDSARSLPNNQYRQAPELTIDYVTMNYLVKPFDNIKIRQAFALAINKDIIAERIWKGARIPSNHIIPQGMPGYNENLTGPTGVKDTKGDATLAKKLLQEGMQEAGYTMSNFPHITLTVATRGNQTAKNAYQSIQQQWKENLGITVNIHDEDWNQLLTDTANTVNNSKALQMWVVDWIADYPDAQDWTTLLFGRDSANNQSNYGLGNTSNVTKQQQMQDLMLKADENQNTTERLKQYQQIEQQLVEDVAWIPIDQRTASYVLKPCVKGVVDNAQQLTPPQDWANIYKTNDSSCATTNKYN